MEKGWKEGAKNLLHKTCSPLPRPAAPRPVCRGPGGWGRAHLGSSHALCTSCRGRWSWALTSLLLGYHTGHSGPPGLAGALLDSCGSQEGNSILEKGKLPSPHLWFHSPGRKWLPGVWWGGLPHRGSRKCGRPQAGMCPGHRAGRVQSHLQNIPQVGTDLGKPMTLSEQGPWADPFPSLCR